jgi:hypothetical protein
MAVRRVGSPNKLWNNTAVGVGGTSTPVLLPRGSEQIVFYITVGGATTVSVEVAHHGSLAANGEEPDQSNPPATFFPISYINTVCNVVFAGAGSAALLIPDFEPAWIRLRSTAATTITAGYEVSGE